MAVPRTTLWDAPEHTKIKHLILREYLKAWYPTLGHGGWRNLVYLDGFAGPGEYLDGSLGSPLVALETLIDHDHPPPSEVECLFIEGDPRRHEHLDRKLSEVELPPTIRIRTFHSSFRECAEHLLADRDSGLGRHPTFAFIDPFGFSGFPLELMGRISEPGGSEVFVTFMSEAVERWIHSDDPAIEVHFDEMFATPEWRSIREMRDAGERLRALHALYSRQLRDRANFPYIRAFEMRDVHDHPLYSLVFATRARRGIEKMKAAMWKADPGGAFSFSDATDPYQVVILTAEPNFRLLERLLLSRFEGRTVEIEEVCEWVDIETPFLSTGHLKTKTLAPMEKRGVVEVTESPRKRPGFPLGTWIRFPEKEPHW